MKQQHKGSAARFVRTLQRSALMVAMSAPALSWAQFDGNVYGVVDLSYGRFETSGQVPRHRFNSNSLTATFVGWQGRYNFESGWTGGLNLETFFRFQDRDFGRNDADPFFSRQAFVSANHVDKGFIRVGRLQTYLFDTTNRFNAMGNSVGMSPAIRQVFAQGNLLGVQGDFYWDNAVSYTSPKREGSFLEWTQVNAMVARGRTATRGQYAGGNVVVNRGLLAMAVSLQSVRIDSDGIADPAREVTWQLGATYNAGYARVYGTYTQTKDRGLEVNGQLASAGVALPLGEWGTVLGQVGQGRSKGAAVNRKHSAVSAAYLYPINSVTDAYVVGMDDRASAQTRGQSYAVGVRWRF
jgi:predicted porin